MKKIILSLIFFIMIICPASAKGHVQDGLCTVFIDNGQDFLFIIEMQRDSLRDGATFQFYQDGKIDKMAWYANGVRHGTFRSFWANGAPKSILDYTDGQLNGRADRYNQNGEPSFQLSYSFGQLHGKGLYYDNGVLDRTVEYFHGRAVRIE